MYMHIYTHILRPIKDIHRRKNITHIYEGIAIVCITLGIHTYRGIFITYNKKESDSSKWDSNTYQGHIALSIASILVHYL